MTDHTPRPMRPPAVRRVLPPWSGATTCAAAFAIAAVAIAACYAAAAAPSLLGAAEDNGGMIASAIDFIPLGAPDGADAAGHLYHPWMANVLAPPAYAQGDAYVITDLGNTFKLDIEQPPGINWTQVLLDQIAAAEDRSQRSVDALRDDTRGVTDDIRRAIDDYIRNNTALLNDRERRFAEYASTTNMTIASMISNDVALNASINQIVQNIQQMNATDHDAVVSAISSQMHYVYNDSPALLMTCVMDMCETDDLGPVTSIPQAISSYVVYGDPKWTAPTVYTVSPFHFGAHYRLPNMLQANSHPGGYIPVYDTFFSYTTTLSLWQGLQRIYMTGEGDNGPQDSSQPLYTNVIVWGCTKHNGYCNSATREHLPHPRDATIQINTQVGYPYHVNMISKLTTPVIKRGADFTGDIDYPVRYDGPSEAPGYGSITPMSYSNTKNSDSIATRNFKYFYGNPHTPFDHAVLAATVSHTPMVDTNELIGVGLGERGELLKYLNSGASRLRAWEMPASGTNMTWPNCTAMPRCDSLSFALGERVPSSSNIPSYWPVFISPQLQFTTWNSYNSLKGAYSTTPQFIDRMNSRILTPSFQGPPPATEAGKLYDVRGQVRIPLPTDAPMNVSHVSLRPSTALLDLAAIGRAYMANPSNTPANLYNIGDSEFASIGLTGCYKYNFGDTIQCDRLGHGINTPASVCIFMGGINSCRTSHSDIGGIVAGRPDFTPDKNARLSQLEGIYSDVIYIPLVPGYTGFRLVIDGVAMFIEYKDVRTDDHIFLSPPRSDRADRISDVPIHWAGANVTTTSQVVAPRSGTMSILAVVSATGSVEIMNEYHVNERPSRPPIIDPLSVTVDITKNGVHHSTVDIGINEHPATVVNNTDQHIPLVRGGLDRVAMRSVSYDYPSFVFAGTTTVPVVAGDHVLFELTAKIEGEIDEWTPPGTMITTRGVSSADVAINAASIMMGVG